MSEPTRKLFIIDRFEGDWAVIEYGRQTFDFPRAHLPADVKQGDVLQFTAGIDRAETENRWRQIRELTQNLFVEEDPDPTS